MKKTSVMTLQPQRHYDFGDRLVDLASLLGVNQPAFNDFPG